MNIESATPEWLKRMVIDFYVPISVTRHTVMSLRTRSIFTPSSRLATLALLIAGMIIRPCDLWAQLPVLEDFLPIERELTDSTGRKISATILSNTETVIKIRRISDKKEFEIPAAKLSTQDIKFLTDLCKAPVVSKTTLNVTVCGAPVQVSRLGNGPIGVLFFGHSGSGVMMEDLMSNTAAFAGLLPAKTSFFLWEYPEAGPFLEVSQAINDYKDGDKNQLRPDFKGVAKEVLDQVRQQTGLKEFLLVGNSLGAGVILWDYPVLSDDPTNQFLLISPTECFMPLKRRTLQRSMLLSALGSTSVKSGDGYLDPFVRGEETVNWVRSNLDVDTVEKIIAGTIDQGHDNWKTNRTAPRKRRHGSFVNGHETIGGSLPYSILSKIIQVKLGLKPNDILAARADPYTLHDPYNVTWNQRAGEQRVVTQLSRRNVVKITIPSGETAIVELIVNGAYSTSRMNTAKYRWKYLGLHSQTVQTGEGGLTEAYETTTLKRDDGATVITTKYKEGNDLTIRAGGITIEWHLGNVLHHYTSRATLTVLPSNSFEKAESLGL